MSPLSSTAKFETRPEHRQPVGPAQPDRCKDPTIEHQTSLDEVRALVGGANAGQVDKLGRDYLTAHLEPIAEALAPHGEDAEMAGLLHDILEDTSVTADELLTTGVPPHVVRALESVSKRPGEPYEDLIERAAADPLGRLVKLADNARNLESNDALALTDREAAARLREMYERARARLLDES